MKNMIRTAAAAAAFSVAGIGLAGVAAAQEDPTYVPPTCTETINGVETAVDCVEPDTEAEVAGIVQTPAVEAVAVSSGTLPYTGSDSSLPLAEAGVALLAGGGALLLVVKRRQAGSHA